MSARWVKVWVCTTCKEELTWDETVNSHGTCPFCGAMDEGTIVKTDEFSRQKPEEYFNIEGMDEPFTLLEIMIFFAILFTVGAIIFKIYFEP